MNRVLLMLLTISAFCVVCSNLKAEDKFEWVPAAAEEKSGGGGVANSTPVLPVVHTVTPKKTADVTKFSKRYVIELEKFGISNNRTNAAKTSAGINAALKYAAKEGFNYIEFPKGTYLIDHTDPIVLSLKNTIVDLNGSVIQMKPNGNKKCMIMCITYGAENLRLTNGTLKGDRYDRDYSTGGTHEHVSTLAIKSGVQLEIDHMHFTESAGFCIGTEKGMERLRDFGFQGVKAKYLESGGFSVNGRKIAMADTCRSSQPYDVSGNFEGEFEFGYIFGYSGYPGIFSRNYRALFFDSNMRFLEARNLLQFKKYSMPENTKFIHLQFNQPSAKDTGEGVVGSLSNLRSPVDVHFHHNRIDNNRSLGFAFCGGQRWIIEDCVFQKNGGGTAPHYGIDFEDGWDMMQDVVVRNNRFKDNHTGDVVVCAGSEMLFEGNEFEKYVYVKERTHNYTFRKNRFIGGNVGFLTRTGVATIEKNIFKGVEWILVEYDNNGNDEGLAHLPGGVVATLQDNLLEDVRRFKGTHFNLSDCKLKNVKFRAGPKTRMVGLNGCEIVDSSIFFEADGPDVIYNIEGCSGDLRVAGPGIARRKCSECADSGLIPMPNEFMELDGLLELKADATISYADNDAKQTAEMLADWLRPATGFKFPVEFGTQGTIVFKILKDASLGDEGYELHVTESVQIHAQTPAGLFYGAQTMRQLLPPEIFSQEKVSSHWNIQCVEIRDIPRFGWRGMHLDVGRHFFATEDIKDFIDLLAMHKLNTFHWHLTEDQGWRIEIKKYPKLTEVGAYRASTPPYGNRDGSDEKKYGGFYTQKEIRDIVAYAAQRHITIIPEIDMPGHMAAAIASYPEFGCTDVPDYNPEVRTRWGVHPYILAPSEKTFRFVEDLLDEVCELFPSKYIHIGGDEAPKEHWEKSKIAQDVIKREGLRNEHELQSYFIRRVEKMLNKRGRLLIGWDEIREGGLSPNAAVMSWRGVKGGIASAKEGHDVVMAPNSHTYFDYYQNSSDKELAKGKEFEAIGGYLPINKVYSFDPVLPGTLSLSEQKHVLGVQAQLWTEYMKTWDKVEYMAFPRVSAIAEVAWTAPKNKDYNDFVERLSFMKQRYKTLGVNAYTGNIPMIPQSLKGTSVTTSLGHYDECQALCVKDGKGDTFFWSNRAPKIGDHLTLTYEKALDKVSRVSVVTGGKGKQAGDILESGVLETSADGKQWREIADFKDGKAEGTAPPETLHIRLRSTSQQSNWLIVHEIVVE